MPQKDATVVRLLREAGALAIGKTNLDQFATGLVGMRSPYPIPRNAIDPTLVPGGSSSGSAVATSQEIVSFALGTDTAGSGRIPAGLNKTVGLKPSVGALSTSGVIPACRTLDCVSVFALTVDDAWKAFCVVAHYDDAEPIRENSRLGTYTNFVNLLDMCGIAVPTGTRSDGLPASVTLLARSGRDGLTASLAPLKYLAISIVMAMLSSFLKRYSDGSN